MLIENTLSLLIFGVAAITIIFIVTVASISYYYKLKLKNKTIHDKMRDEVIKLTVLDIEGPMGDGGDSYYKRTLGYNDSHQGLRKFSYFEFSESILPSKIVDSIDQEKKISGSWSDKIGLESSEIKQKRLALIKEWMIENIDRDTINGNISENYIDINNINKLLGQYNRNN